ncbi:MAG: hypothetical protein FWD48_05360 [Oscillospiraceae bacterium]|nr:hypothetical protein [Oscillospiraceae bacterium]
MANALTRALGTFIPYFREKPPQDISIQTKAIFEAKEGEFFHKNSKVLNKQVKDFDDNKLTMREVYKNACEKPGSYGAFENLDKKLRNLAANKKMLLVMDELEKNPSSKEFTDYLIKNDYLHDPAMRLGIANASKGKHWKVGGQNSDFFKEVDKALSEKVFADTFVPTIREDNPSADKKDIDRNLSAQRTMMKMMLMGQLGESNIYKDKEKGDWNHSMTDMFLSGQRVGIILPGVEGNSKENDREREQLITAIYGEKRGKNDGNVGRFSATHNVDLKSISGKGDKQFKEVKCAPKNFNMHRVFDSQYGMNIAAGGFGKTVNGKTITNDGTCGHLYSHIKKGDANHHGALLVGFESEAGGMKNHLGHSHKFAIKPKAELASCFGTQKNSTVGDNYGGREMDLSGVNPKAFTETMKKFDDYIKENQEKAKSMNLEEREKAVKNLENVTTKLMGPKMTPTEFTQFMQETCKFDANKTKDMFPTRNKSFEKNIEVEKTQSKEINETKEKSNVINKQVNLTSISPKQKAPPPPVPKKAPPPPPKLEK